MLAFELPGSPPAQGFLIFVDRTEDAEPLEQDIRKSARDTGSAAHTPRERNVVAHFFTAAAPTQSQQRPIRACLDE